MVTRKLDKLAQVVLLVLGAVGPQDETLLEAAIYDARTDQPDERRWLFVF
jgi:hypothetical protein